MNRDNALAALGADEIQALAEIAHKSLCDFLNSITPRDLILRAALHTERKGRFSLKAVGADLRDQAAAYQQSQRDLDAYGQGFEQWIQSDTPEPPRRSLRAGHSCGARREA